MPVDPKREVERLNARIDGLHEVLEAQSNEIDALKEEVAERERLYDDLSKNADAIAAELIDAMESRRPLADALAMLHDAVSEHMAKRNPASSKVASGVVLHGDPVDVALYEQQRKVQQMLQNVKGLKWQPLPQ